MRQHHLSGMRDWYLVLTPADGGPTLREGPPDDHPHFPGGYLCGSPPKLR